MRPPVTNKRDMYARAARGEFGNVIPRWDDFRQWSNDPLGRWSSLWLWGVQSKVANDPRCRLNCPKDEIGYHLRTTGLMSDGYIISPMIHQIGRVLWEGDVTTFYACGNLNPEPGNWRRHMQKPVQWRCTQYRTFFRQFMTPDSYDDLTILLEEYPGHVIELSILDTCYGTVLGRNAVCWEVRRY